MMWSWVVPAALFVALLCVGADKGRDHGEAEGWEMTVMALLSGCVASAVTALIATWG